MLTLCLDTSTAAVTVALVDDAGEVLAARRQVDAQRHGELLSPMVREVLAGRRPDRVSVGLGPGPFTSLRVGIATATALGDAWRVSVDGGCSLDLVGCATTGDVEVWQDARRREVYAARYSNGVRVDGPRVDLPGSMLPGDGVRLLGAVAGLAHVAALGLTVEEAWPDPAMLTRVERTTVLAPKYLRRPDALTLVERGLA